MVLLGKVLKQLAVLSVPAVKLMQRLTLHDNGAICVAWPDLHSPDPPFACLAGACRSRRPRAWPHHTTPGCAGSTWCWLSCSFLRGWAQPSSSRQVMMQIYVREQVVGYCLQDACVHIHHETCCLASQTTDFCSLLSHPPCLQREHQPGQLYLSAAQVCFVPCPVVCSELLQDACHTRHNLSC